MNDDVLVKEALDYMRSFLSDDPGGHDAFHSIRVLKTAERIAVEEGADLLTVRLAAILHDIDDVKLSPETTPSLSRAASFLDSHGVPEGVKHAVLTAVREVSFKGSDSAAPSTAEGKCVQDADRLDALGAIGVARTFAYGGSHSRPMYDPSVSARGLMTEEEYRKSNSTSVNHFYEKLFFLKDMMNTASAKRMAEARDGFMHEFIDEFMLEWEGER